MVQDPQGYLWLGTRNGLCRFDGYRFQVYHNNQEGNNRLPHSNLIRHLYQNPNGLLWIRFFGEVYSCYDTNQGRFVDYSPNGKDPRKLRECTILKNGETWLWRNGTGALRVVYQDGKVNSLMFTEEAGLLGSNSVHFITQDSGGHVWVGTSKGLTLVDRKGGKIIMGDKNILSEITIGKVLYFIETNGSVYQTTGDGRITQCFDAPAHGITLNDMREVVRAGHSILILTRGDTYEYDTRQHTLTRSEILQAPDGYIYVDNLGNYSVFDLDGYMHYFDADGNKTTLKVFEHSIQRESYGLAKVSNDGKGRLWISTQGNGLFIYDMKNRDVQHFKNIDDSRNTTTGSNIINHLLDHNGNLWVTIDNQGVERVSIVGEDLERIIPANSFSKSRASEMLTLSREPDGSFLTSNHAHEVLRVSRTDNGWQSEVLFDVGDDNCRSTLHAADGTIWAGTDYHGLRIGDRWYRHQKDDDQSLGGDHVLHLYQDKKARVWVSCASGGLDLAVPSEKGYTFRHFFDRNGLGRKIITIYECPHGDFFAGTDRGIIRFRPDELLADSSRYTTYFDTNEDNWFDIHNIQELPDGRIVYASTGAGIYVSDSRNHASLSTFRHYTIADGLPDMTCASMCVDTDGMLWIGTQWGLARFNPQTGAINRYHLSANTLGNVFAYGYGQLLESGHLLFTTGHGLLDFNPKTVVQQKQHMPKPRVSNIFIGGVPIYELMIEDQTFNKETPIRLNHNQNTLAFHVSCFDYGNESTTEYSFLLEGVDKDWSMPSTQNTVSYSNLSPGDYTLRIRSRNTEYGNEFSESSFTFTITPPFWATWWAYLIYIIVGLLIFWVIFHSLWSQYKLRRQLELEKRMTEFKSEFFMNISHELRTPLMLIQGSSERLRTLGLVQGEAKQPVKNLQQSVNRLLRLISQLLTFNKLQNDRLHLRLQPTDIVKLAREITLSFNDSAAMRNITLTFMPTVASCEIPLDRDMFDKMLYNLLSNALKYTPDGGNITVNSRLDDSRFTISVTDTGIGIKPEQKAELFKRFARSTVAVDSIGIGLNLAYQLARAHHGELSHADNPGGGSIFTVTLPVDDTPYSTDDWATEVVNEEKENSKDVEYEFAEMPAVPLNDRRVVIAEDDNDVRQYLARELGRYFTVVAMSDGQAALDEIRREKPELIVSDLVMPRMDGIELLRRVRQDDDLFDIPFILLTAMDDARHQMQGIKSGADSYIPKPVSVELLATRCMKLLEQYDRLKKAFSKEELTPQQNPIIASDQDKKFRQILDAKIEARLSDPRLNIDELGESMNYRHSQFFTRVKEVTGMPPGEYIRRIKMDRAALMLQDETITISEVAYQLGFSDPLYFGRCFKQHYGMTPSQYRKGS